MERWWICTDQLARGGRKLLGPFESRELAISVRWYVEAHPDHRPRTYWVDSEAPVLSVSGADNGDNQ